MIVTNSDRLPGSRYVMINNNDGQLPFIINQHGQLDAKSGHTFDRETQVCAHVYICDFEY